MPKNRNLQKNPQSTYERQCTRKRIEESDDALQATSGRAAVFCAPRRILKFATLVSLVAASSSWLWRASVEARARARRSAQQRGALRRSVQLKIRNFRALIDHRVDELLSSCAAPLPVIVRSSTIYGIVERSSRYCQRLKVFSITAACR